MAGDLIEIPENTTLALGERDERGLTPHDNLALNAVVSRHNLIQAVIKEVFKESIHYGNIPGCGDKPVLLQPGAEMLLMIFKISSRPVETKYETEKDGLPVIAYKVVRECYSQDGSFIGSGVGYCTSEENKYKWRKSYKTEFDSILNPAHRRLKKGVGKDGKEYSTYSIANDNPADLENTILKMADKRALVAASRTVTGASSFFGQDMEDMDADYIWGRESSKPDIKEPQATKSKERSPSNPTEKINEVQVTLFHTVKTHNEWKDVEAKARLLEKFGFASSKDITTDKFQEVLTFFNGGIPWESKK